MSRTELVKIVASWIFITAVFSLAWLYAPAIFGIIATAVALAAVLALAAVAFVTLRTKGQ